MKIDFVKPEKTPEAAHGYVFVDQFNGSVLHKVNFLKDAPGYRVSRFNRSIHTGDYLGAWGHLIASLSSLLRVVMVVTRLAISLEKLA